MVLNLCECACVRACMVGGFNCVFNVDFLLFCFMVVVGVGFFF